MMPFLPFVMAVVFADNCTVSCPYYGKTASRTWGLTTGLTDAKKGDFVMLDEMAFNLVFVKVHTALIYVADFSTKRTMKVMVVF